MKRVYEFEMNKKADITKMLETDPYAEDSFARVGYKVRDGAGLSEDKTKMYLYISGSDEFIKKADEKLKPLAKVASTEVEKRVIEKIVLEEETAESGFGSMFG
ncbi:MAG: hypothetical protein AABX38_07970 [Candidatus Micrarchaeota archaeon]